MKKLIVRFVKDESGVTAIEYGLIAGLISVVILVAVQLLGGSLEALFNQIANALGAALSRSTFELALRNHAVSYPGVKRCPRSSLSSCLLTEQAEPHSHTAGQTTGPRRASGRRSLTPEQRGKIL